MILVTCSDRGIAIFAKILKTIFDMILIIGPILAMVSLAYLLFRVITSPDADKKEKYKGNIKNAVIALVVVVFLPVFVNLVMNMTYMKDTFQIAECWSEASKVSLSDKAEYINKKQSKDKTGTLIIDPSKYKGTDENPNAAYTPNNITGGDYTGGNVDYSTRKGQIQGAINWAINIANDNSFTYGKKPYASDCGCYFCGTNGNKAKAAAGHSDGTPPKGKSWDKTYVCMTFINAAYAHGAKDPIFYKYCKKGSTALDGNARVQQTKDRLGDRVTYLGHIPYSQLEAGDILFAEYKHVAMYIGGGKLVEATGGTWTDDSISVSKLSKSTYSNYYTGVFRYNGYTPK